VTREDRERDRLVEHRLSKAFEAVDHVEFLISNGMLALAVQNFFDAMAMDEKTDELSPASIESHLGSAKVLRIAKGQSLTWKDILEKHIPNKLVRRY
jgi:hypothetical protein